MQFFDKKFFLVLLICFGWMQQLSAADNELCPLPTEDVCSFPASDNGNTIAQKARDCAEKLKENFDKLEVKDTSQEKFEQWLACTKKLVKANQKLDNAFDAKEPVDKETLTEAQKQISATLGVALSKAERWLYPASDYKRALCRATLEPLRQLSSDINKDACEKKRMSCAQARSHCSASHHNLTASTSAYCSCVKNHKNTSCCENTSGCNSSWCD